MIKKHSHIKRMYKRFFEQYVMQDRQICEAVTMEINYFKEEDVVDLEEAVGYLI